MNNSKTPTPINMYRIKWLISVLQIQSWVSYSSSVSMIGYVLESILPPDKHAHKQTVSLPTRHHLLFDDLYVCRHELLRETSWLAGLRDPNIARVVGLCSQDEPMCALLEHSESGELPRFLSQRCHEDDNQGPSIRWVVFIYLSIIYFTFKIPVKDEREKLAWLNKVCTMSSKKNFV